MSSFVTADPNRILLVDISKWQDAPDTVQIPNFAVMKSRGVRGVIIKCGEGDALDRAFLVYQAALRDIGLPYGFYWYYNNKYSPDQQGKLFVDTIKRVGFPPLGIWLDLEDRLPGKYAGWKNWYDFLFDLEVAFPKKLIGIYTGHYYFKEFTLGVGIPQASLKWFGKFPLWVASYGVAPLPTEPWGDNWTLWQFTDLLDGIGYGVESKELDGNYFNGDERKFMEVFNLEGDTHIHSTRKINIYSNGTYQENS